MAEQKKGNSKLAIWVLIGGAVAIGGYVYYKDKKKAAASSPNLNSSGGLGSSTPLADVALNPVEQPNSFNSTPVIQNYDSQMSTTNVSSTQVVTPPSHIFFGSRPWSPPLHHPTSPHMTPFGRGQ
jgi:hypothetical protein